MVYHTGKPIESVVYCLNKPMFVRILEPDTIINKKLFLLFLWVQVVIILLILLASEKRSESFIKITLLEKKEDFNYNKQFHYLHLLP